MSYSPLCNNQIQTPPNPAAEKNTRRAMILTGVMMVLEIVGGYYYNSMALLADGWHMSSHMLALGLALMAYVLARRFAQDGRFAFGTWKIEILGSYTSALLLVLIAGTMLFESVVRLINPSAIHFDQAIAIALVGLLVNLICAFWLHEGHGHSHGHDSHGHDSHTHDSHSHHHDDHDQHQHKDLNLRAAYIHVLTDALTSVLAIVALLGGKYFGFIWLDPLMGIVGGVLVAVWALGLLKQSGKILLDAEMDTPLVDKIRAHMASDQVAGDMVYLHLRRVNAGQYA